MIEFDLHKEDFWRRFGATSVSVNPALVAYVTHFPDKDDELGHCVISTSDDRGRVLEHTAEFVIKEIKSALKEGE